MTSQLQSEHDTRHVHECMVCTVHGCTVYCACARALSVAWAVVGGAHPSPNGWKCAHCPLMTINLRLVHEPWWIARTGSCTALCAWRGAAVSLAALQSSWRPCPHPVRWASTTSSSRCVRIQSGRAAVCLRLSLAWSELKQVLASRTGCTQLMPTNKVHLHNSSAAWPRPAAPTEPASITGRAQHGCRGAQLCMAGNTHSWQQQPEQQE